MRLVRLVCEDCDREFAMAAADAVDPEGMSCPIDACQGAVVDADAELEEDDEEDEVGDEGTDEDETPARSRRSRRR